jgi:hypothetical protein
VTQGAHSNMRHGDTRATEDTSGTSLHECLRTECPRLPVADDDVPVLEPHLAPTGMHNKDLAPHQDPCVRTN